MGISSCWKLLHDEGVVERYNGGRAEDHARIVEAVDGKAIAVDLSMWIMQVRERQGGMNDHRRGVQGMIAADGFG